ncbi:MAG: SUMF1/EgtB/PvdO family nonheme iron enzyme [Gammaproteobacteria bacterium]|nr:SUMF1/EgtB/PvdO family nonheme iron enzyme [Gammaproteobacteria bacterium]
MKLDNQRLPQWFPEPWAHSYGQDRYGVWHGVYVEDIEVRFRWMPPGSFMMGSKEEEAGRRDSEGPRHPVRFEQGFWLAETACTQNLWQTIMNTNPSRFSDNKECPVERVKKSQINEFISILNKRLPGFDARLPSESEWEYGCRAGSESTFWFGDELTTDDANYDGNYPYLGGKKGEYRETTLPVKSFTANPWGLYQMHGNVWEYCEDGWHDNYDDAPRDGSAWGRGDDNRSVLRGGSWNLYGSYLRSAYRYDSLIGIVSAGVGFRLARGPKSSSPETGGAD